MTSIYESKQPGSLLTQSSRTKKRNAAEIRFRIYGLAAIALSLMMLLVLVATIFTKGVGAYQQTFATLEVELREDILDKKGNRNPAEIKKVPTFHFNLIA